MAATPATRRAREKGPNLPAYRAERDDTAKAYVLRWFANLVEEGVAQIKRSADGESECDIDARSIASTEIPCGGLPE